MRLYVGLIVGSLRRALRPAPRSLIENLVLRQQLAVCIRQPRRLRLRREDRRFWSVIARTWTPWRSHLQLVQPETVIRWHRSARSHYWTWRSRRRSPGRPRISAEVRDLIVRITRENQRWGAIRIVGECFVPQTVRMVLPIRELPLVERPQQRT